MKKILVILMLLMATSIFANQYCKVIDIKNVSVEEAEYRVNEIIRTEQDGPGLSILTDIKVLNDKVFLIFTDDK